MPERIRETGHFIFQVIAGRHDRGGADESVIVEGVDNFQRLALADDELRGGLQRLLVHGAIEVRAGKFVVSSVHEGSLPRTAKGEVSFAARGWSSFVKDVPGEYEP